MEQLFFHFGKNIPTISKPLDSRKLKRIFTGLLSHPRASMSRSCLRFYVLLISPNQQALISAVDLCGVLWHVKMVTTLTVHSTVCKDTTKVPCQQGI